MQHKFEIEVRVFRRRLPAFPCVGGSRHHLKGKKLLSMTRGVLCSLALGTPLLNTASRTSFV